MKERRTTLSIAIVFLLLCALAVSTSAAHAAPVMPPLVWDSGWFTLDPNSSTVLKHDLGGNTDTYEVELWFRDDTIGRGGLGIHNRFVGGSSNGRGYEGVTWNGLTTSTITVARYPDDTRADQVRVRITRALSHTWGCAWTPIAKGGSLTLNKLGGDPGDYVVGLHFQTAMGANGINNIA